ncbi:endonuclease domain-containing protein [Amycolatopsis sp. NPDC051903]|uniref:endonuclease domain-containing protein n=1 Tax=Amycolatopsis sp. NPDC051903 TaxID=3363936 RepID=UPI0037BB56ED
MFKKWGLTDEAYTALMRRQGFSCGICGGVFERGQKLPAVDHDHACCSHQGSCGLCVRGLLCTRCNIGLGYFRDNVQSLEAAVRYLTTHVDLVLTAES